MIKRKSLYIPRTFQKLQISQFISYCFLIVGSLIMLVPFIWMILSAFKAENQIVSYPPQFIPNPFTLENFKILNERIPILRLYRNSLFVAIIVTSVSVYTSALVGYIFAKFSFKGRELLFILIIATMMIPWPATLVPLYQLCLKLKLTNSLQGVMAPYFMSAFGIFMIRQFMHSIPDELLDAARIDGASEFRIFNSIALPNAKQAFSALAIFVFLWQWDNLLWPMLIITDEKLFTLPIAMSYFGGQWWSSYGPMLAGASIAVIPMLIIFIIFQRNITEGITMTGMKG